MQIIQIMLIYANYANYTNYSNYANNANYATLLIGKKCRNLSWNHSPCRCPCRSSPCCGNCCSGLEEEAKNWWREPNGERAAGTKQHVRDFLSSFVDVRLSMFMVHTLLYRYGTYYHGIDYNTATDENPRYNEDGGKTFAVVTDENVYYQLWIKWTKNSVIMANYLNKRSETYSHLS